MLAELEQASGGLWPYLVVIVIGFLPTEVWRVAGVLAGRNLDENSQVMVWVRMVATALVAGVVAKLLMSPSGALAVVPLWGRLGALAAGVAVYFVARRSVLAGLFAGEMVLIGVCLRGSQL
ncbi:MAG: AzlD domain-containing protein [Hyphomicrobiales bacterium]|nr:AzlD domain-containing protein [Hyphomicrobiales bacterium]